MISFAQAIIAWYAKNKRDLPWRFQEREGENLYKTWLSEVMLQQTTVPTVQSYFKRFLQKWPTLHHLAKASEHDVLTEWQGLGYYSRARNLLKCAQQVSADYKGEFPQEEKLLQKLPGIGPYTAAAILAIGADKPAVALDGNIERIMARIHKIEQPLREAKPLLKKLAAMHLPKRDVSAYTQGLMDLGASICTPAAPKCGACPVQQHCEAYKDGVAHLIPPKPIKKALPQKFTTSFIHVESGKVLLRYRRNGNLLKNMIELPSTPWEVLNGEAATFHVAHTFTHFQILIKVEQATPPPTALEGEEFWHPIAALSQLPIPTMTKKVLKYAQIL